MTQAVSARSRTSKVGTLRPGECPMTSSKTPGDGESIARATEDDVEGHKARLPDAGESVARATEDDVEGHKARLPEDGESIARATEDDVEGHNIGYGSPTLARAVYRDREREIQREVSRNSLLRDAKLVIKKRKG
jgi:hypothetical protein